MAYLMNIGFDNSSRLFKDVFYFEYKDVRFKLIQNNIRKWSDTLLTIIHGNYNMLYDKVEKDKAYISASEFLSALSWENDSLVKLWDLGGRGIPENFQLRKARPVGKSFPRIPFCGNMIGYNICKVPEIENEDQRNALILYREASSSNNYYLAFLFFWQILGIGGNDAIGWINKTYRRNRNEIRLSNNEFKKLLFYGEDLGRYFYDDCRNAIAHIIKRHKGKVKLKLDTPADNRRIILSEGAIKEFARFYIKNKLKLNKKMYLVRKNGKGFPTFCSEEYVNKYPCKIAYEKPSMDQIIKKMILTNTYKRGEK